MHNLSGSVRSYELQSQIFPEQGAMIAIGAQVQATSAQGTAASSLLDFNNNLYDRILGGKDDSPASKPFAFSNNNNETFQSKFDSLKNNLNTLHQFFFPDETIIDPESSQQSSGYKNALKNIITYFQDTVKSNTAGRAIIPIKISLTMDGIGGLVIGHLFKMPPSLLPRGYGSDNVGGKLIQTITSIGHKVENGDWTTTIDALNIVTKEPSGIVRTFNDLLIETKTGFKVTVPSGFQNLTGPWSERAFQIITRFEGFEPVAKLDAGTLRGGYGSPIKLINGKPVTVGLNTTFTQEEAKSTLVYLITNEYGPGVIGQIGISTWGRLTPNQQAALTSYAYNAGTGALKNWGIAKNLQDGRDDLAAQNIKRGPITTGGVVSNGLITRREQESILFTTA